VRTPREKVRVTEGQTPEGGKKKKKAHRTTLKEVLVWTGLEGGGKVKKKKKGKRWIGHFNL